MKIDMNKVLITSALPYINGTKHVGNLIGSMLPADFYARFQRQQGKEVLYICGTDEHGTPAELGAQAAGLNIEQYCQQNHCLQRDIYRSFDISFDYFGRTSTKMNRKCTQEIFARLNDHGYIFEKSIKQYYSSIDKRFLPDRYIEGTCPRCHYTDARGDQCDKCGALLSPEELLSPRSALSGSTDLQQIAGNHLFFDLGLLEPQLKSWISNQDGWPPLVRGIANQWLKEGLKARCITRDLHWGVPVPLPAYHDKVFYVWFDAPMGYISMTQEWAAANGWPESWQAWWLAPEDVNLVQFMAKDNVPFHTLFWPAMLKGSGQDWLSASYIKGVNWLTYEGDKFSTSRRRGVFTDKALELFPADYWRYGLFAMIPESSDADFSFQAFAQIINKDLADSLGNFINRTFKIIENHFGGILPAGFLLDDRLRQDIGLQVKSYLTQMEEIQFRKTGHHIRKMWDIGNEYISQAQPWQVLKTDRPQVIHILKNCLYLLNIFSCALAPIIPALAGRIRQALALQQTPFPSLESAMDAHWLDKEIHLDLQVDCLVKKIPPERVEALTAAFSGSQDTDSTRR
ncbi:methionyl-tRNA synthetase [Biostraticola tofi]|uniref:Methionine--tRNA ligase n=2 Tax=Biostraticola tofi TaxID=466109 RepID=A0A4R3YT20_9GAMM|nr:methionyl-tRNA synthetase [Biostraticola tofi]